MSMLFDEKEAQRQVDEIIVAGAPIVKLNIFDILNNYVPSKLVQDQIDYTRELYSDLANKLSMCSEDEQRTFLKTLKDVDIIDNQKIEQKDSFLITLYRNFEKTAATDLLLEKYYYNKSISADDFINIHDQLLCGTSSENKLGLRTNDLKFVGYYTDNPNTTFHYGICKTYSKYYDV